MLFIVCEGIIVSPPGQEFCLTHLQLFPWHSRHSSNLWGSLGVWPHDEGSWGHWALTARGIKNPGQSVSSAFNTCVCPPPRAHRCLPFPTYRWPRCPGVEAREGEVSLVSHLPRDCLLSGPHRTLSCRQKLVTCFVVPRVGLPGSVKLIGNWDAEKVSLEPFSSTFWFPVNAVFICSMG